MDLAAAAEIDQDRKALDLPVSDKTMHLVFTGASGTGKTTVAREIGQLYYHMGLVEKDPSTSAGWAEVSGPDLVGKYKGQSGAKVKELFEGSDDGQEGMIGGVIFIDEAYSMVSGKDDEYGQQAVAELLRQAENHRDSTVVILAGYDADMKELMSMNTGMPRRFPTTLTFPEMSLDDRYKVMQRRMTEGKYGIGTGAQAEGVRHGIMDALQYTGAGNAGDVRNLFEKVEMAQRVRLANKKAKDGKPLTAQQLSRITPADVKAGMKAYVSTSDVRDPLKGRLVPTSRKKPAAKKAAPKKRRLELVS